MSLKFFGIYQEIIKESTNNVAIIGDILDYLGEYQVTGQKTKEIEFIINSLKGDAKWLFLQILAIYDDLRPYNINTGDVMQEHNWGLKNGNLALFDVGYGNFFEEFDVEPEEINLNEYTSSSRINEFTELAEKIAKKLNLGDVKFLGMGANGYAFDTTSGKILKITSDKTEAINSKKLLGKNLKHVAKIFSVNTLKKDNYNGYYIIVLEKLDTSNYDKLKNILISIYDWFDESTTLRYDPDIIDNISKKHPEVAKFIYDIYKLGYEATQNKWQEKLIHDTKYNWDDISEIVPWIRGAKEANTDSYYSEPPEHIYRLVKKLGGI